MRRLRALRPLLLLLWLALSLGWVGPAVAGDLVLLKRADLAPSGEVYRLHGNYGVALTPALEDALVRGVTLPFVQMFEAERPRSYWFPEDIAVTQRTVRIAYNNLLRQYRVLGDEGASSYDQLADALEALGSFGGWPVLAQKAVVRGQGYRVRVRMFLDTTQLPKPLQINAVGSDRWALDSGWREWAFRP